MTHHSSFITHHFFTHHFFPLGLLVIFAAGAGVVLGCGWDGFENSVRFNFSTSERERQRLPPLPYKLGGAGDGRGAQRADAGAGYYVAEQESAETDALWARADEAVRAGELARAVTLLREFAARPGDGERANSAADQLDALAALDAGSAAVHVRAYLDARRRYDLWVSAGDAGKGESSPADAPGSSEGASGVEPSDAVGDEARRPPEDDAGGAAGFRRLDELLREPPRDKNLEDNFAYLSAAVLYREGRAAEASAAFQGLSARHPRSEKREAALFMAARAEMSRSRAYLGPGAGATSEDACPDCRDEAWRAAREGFSRVGREYPRGRLAGEARGWLAYLALRVGDTPGALAEYYRMLGDGRDAGANAEALKSLRLARGRAAASDMERVEEELADEPPAALAYAYHDIYNYTLSYYFTVPDLDPAAAGAECLGPDGGGAGWKREQAAEVGRRAERAGLARVARFAARMMERYPGAQAGGAFTVRVAQANLEMGETESALALARRALGAGVTGAERAGALWVEAAAEYRRRDLEAARRALARLVAEFPGGDVETRARTLLAIASEEAGDLDAALEQYLALSYDADVAYFVDVLMTPEQLAAFVARRPRHARRDELRYALGVRYLRAGRYREARDVLPSVRTTAAGSPGLYDDGEEREPEDPKSKIRRSFYDEETFGLSGGAADPRESGVSAGWVLRDLKTAEDLERLSDAAESGASFEERAEGLYQLASYLYEGSNLKFYNPAAWRGMRAEMLSSLDESRYRSPGEAQTLWRHAQEHESLARALKIYLEVVRRYPGTRAARDAFYTAVLCHERLSGFNAYWRRAYGLGLHAGERVVTFADLRHTYPRYRLPLDGVWRPSARTVDGRAAWPAPPAPRKPTGAERVRRKVRRAEAVAVQGWTLFGEVAGGRARRWSLALLCSLAVLFVWRATRRSRGDLYELLRRAAARRAPPPAVFTRPSSSFAAQEPYAPGARLRASAASVGRTLAEVARDERGRAAIALNLITHGLLTALLWALSWALRAG